MAEGNGNGCSRFNTGFLQPAQPNYRTLEASTFDDPCSLSMVEKLEKEQQLTVRNTDDLSRLEDQIPAMEVCSDESSELVKESPKSTKINWFRIAIPCCFALVAAETIFAFFANSVSCVVDVLRWLSDGLGHYKLSRNDTKTHRRCECIMLLIFVLLLWCATAILLLSTIHRLHSAFYLNLPYMLVAAGLSFIANSIMICLHLTKTFRRRTYLPLAQFIGVRAQQFIHIVGNHGTSLIVLSAAALVNMQPKWEIFDPVAAIVLTVLLLCNTVSVITKCYKEFRIIGSNRENYQSI